jgi:hypothetical protein
MYATANSPAIAKIASNPGSSGVGVANGASVGVGVTGVGAGVIAGGAMGVAVGVDISATHGPDSVLGSQGSFGSVPVSRSIISR